MPLNLQHKKWEPTGRLFDELDEFDQPTGKTVWRGKVGEQQIHDGAYWQPYIWDSENSELRYSAADNRIGFQSDKQVLKKAANVLCSSLKLFVQRETSPDVWENEPHGLPTRNILHNKRFKDKVLVDEDGYCIGWLEFPDAQYDLQIGMQVGRAKRGVLGFRFRAPISANIRMQIVKDGITKRTGGVEFIKDGGGPGYFGNPPREERTVGARYKDFETRWTWKEAAYHSIEVENSSEYPGKWKATITIGPYDYMANTWVEVVPLTWGSTEAATDGSQFTDTFFDNYNGFLGTGRGSAGGAYYDTGMTWDNVTVPAGATAENGCNLEIDVVGKYGGGAYGRVYTLDTRDVTAWSADYMPRDDALPNVHASYVTWDEPGTGTQVSPELKTIIQDRLDDVADPHQSGDEIGILWVNNAGSGLYITTYTAEESGTGPALTIVYSEAAVSIPMDTLTLTGATPSLTVVPGTVSLAMDTLTLAGSPKAISLSLGAVTLPMDLLTLAAAVPSFTWNGVNTIAMDALTLSGSPPALSLATGAVSLPMDALVLTGAAPSTTISLVTYVLLKALSLASATPSLSLGLGETQIAMDALALVSAPESLTWSGLNTIAMDTLVLAGASPSATLSLGAVSIPIAALVLSGAAESITAGLVVPGKVSMSLGGGIILRLDTGDIAVQI